MSALLPGMEGDADRDRKLGQWDTLPPLARALVRWASVGLGDLVVDASCGIGNVLDAAEAEGASTFGIEIDDARAEVARRRGFAVVTLDAFDPKVAALVERRRVEVGASRVIAVGNPPFEHNGALRHPEEWLRWALRVHWIAPLVTLASAARLPVWRERVKLQQADVLVPRPKFGPTGGSQEIAFFRARAYGGRIGEDYAPRPASIDWCEWCKLGAPEVTP